MSDEQRIAEDQQRIQQEEEARAREQEQARRAAQGRQGRQGRQAESRELSPSGFYVSVCRVVSGEAGKDRVVIEPGTTFDPTVRETELSEEEIQSLLEHGAIKPTENPEEEAQPDPPPTGEDSVMGARGSPPNSPQNDDRRQGDETISRDEPR